MESFDFDRQTGCLKVIGEFTVYQATQAKSALQDAIASGQLKSFDLAEVTEMDTSAVQLLLCVQQSATVTRISAAARNVLQLLNLETQLLTAATESSHES